MLEVINGLLTSLNLIEVRGSQNLALLYNAIDTLKQMRDAYSKPVAQVPVENNAVAHVGEAKEEPNVENPTQ
jgi:hypothetical protein